ncbi:MAG: hypothetical protein E7434_00675 [Ruminococcaceae bacterium]|nr:hypothetical protein [Oscillospiraceae bacterium]
MYEDGIISKHEAQQAIVFCNNSGPGFFVGMLGGYIFQDTVVGLVLYAIHILSAILCTYLFQPRAKDYTLKRINHEKKSFAQNFTQAISASCEAMLNVSALVVLFSIIISILDALKLFSALPQNIQALIFGSLELTSGIALTKNTVNSFAICAFLMGWGGLCVHLQAMAIWNKQGLSVRNYLPAKLLHGLLSAFLALSFMQGIVTFIITSLIFIIICGILRNFIKFGVEKRKDLLYNTSKR